MARTPPLKTQGSFKGLPHDWNILGRYSDKIDRIVLKIQGKYRTLLSRMDDGCPYSKMRKRGRPIACVHHELFGELFIKLCTSIHGYSWHVFSVAVYRPIPCVLNIRMGLSIGASPKIPKSRNAAGSNESIESDQIMAVSWFFFGTTVSC